MSRPRDHHLHGGFAGDTVSAKVKALGGCGLHPQPLRERHSVSSRKGGEDALWLPRCTDVDGC